MSLSLQSGVVIPGAVLGFEPPGCQQGGDGHSHLLTAQPRQHLTGCHQEEPLPTSGGKTKPKQCSWKVTRVTPPRGDRQAPLLPASTHGSGELQAISSDPAGTPQQPRELQSIPKAQAAPFSLFPHHFFSSPSKQTHKHFLLFYRHR